jgi:sulfite reductase (NADPH) hemoprotein beta-component
MKVDPIVSSKSAPPSEVEHIKSSSRYLRGNLAETLDGLITGSIPEDDNRLLKHHGSYMQDDRDLRNERQKQKLEPSYQFMVRIRAAGGIITPEQWLAMDKIAHEYANGTLRLTTRQSFQMHGILKWNMKKGIRRINDALLTTLAACGDVIRNVMCNPTPYESDVHAEVYKWAERFSQHLDPRTRA